MHYNNTNITIIQGAGIRVGLDGIWLLKTEFTTVFRNDIKMVPVNSTINLKQNSLTYRRSIL